jgi:hypothetical protein
MAEIIIPGAQTLKTLEKTLKENYLNPWRNGLTTEPSPLLGKIKKVKLTSNEIVASAPQGLSGGFGYGAEGLEAPAAGNVMYERFKTYAKDMYVNIAISAKAVRLTGNGGAMTNALHSEVTAAYETAKWNLGRSLFGNGKGVLANTEAVSNSNTIKLVTEPTVVDDKGNTISNSNPHRLIKEGLIIDIYATGATVDSEPQAKAVRVISVDRVNNTITISGNAVTLDAGFITIQNSYGREITGIGAIFDDSVDTLYGVKKSENKIIVPTVVDANTDIDDSVIWDAVEGAETYKNSKIDTILMGKSAYKHYIEYLRTNNVRVESMTKEITGGFKAIDYAFGNRNIDVVYEQFIPDDEAWCLDSKSLELHTQEWDFADLQGGGIFNLMERSSVYRALLANYGNLICNNPGGLVRIVNCA